MALPQASWLNPISKLQQIAIYYQWPFLVWGLIFCFDRCICHCIKFLLSVDSTAVDDSGPSDAIAVDFF